MAGNIHSAFFSLTSLAKRGRFAARKGRVDREEGGDGKKDEEGKGRGKEEVGFCPLQNFPRVPMAVSTSAKLNLIACMCIL